MGLEMTGLARPNSAEVWIDPVDYQPSSLKLPTSSLTPTSPPRSTITSSAYWIERLWPFAVRSISDWKNDYLDICTVLGSERLRRSLHH